jgi:hypothetical protein
MARRGLWLVACAAVAVSCVAERDDGMQTSVLPPVSSGTSGGEESSDTLRLDLPADDSDTADGCDADENCDNRLDLLFVIDNSNSMAEEQLNLAVQFDDLIEKLEALQADVNIMVTTTDMWNPSCDGPWVKPDYEAAEGAPIMDACTDRMQRFVGFDDVDHGHVCTDVCTTGAVPEDPFIHFAPGSSNVMGGTVADALSCVAPQGVDGCGFESPLESMMQALDPGACWNDPEGCEDERWQWVEKPFLRPGAVLAVVMITDEADCSVKNWETMTSPAFMEVDPELAEQRTTSAVCWNAGVECTGFDGTTQSYAECHAVDRDLDGTVVGQDDFDGSTPALQPISRYIDYLAGLKASREVLMLGILGVPEVTRYSEDPPPHPIEGGVEALVYRDWLDGDILPGDDGDVAGKNAEFGIGPGCTGVDETGAPTGQAIPPVRVRQVCESLNEDDEVRCCIESICSQNFANAIDCLTGLIEDVVVEG